MSEHWMEDAERVEGGTFLIGEDDWGMICVPAFGWHGLRWRDFSLINPIDWLRYFSSWLQGKIVWLES